jgi:tetratricopeptide (TPR) repeat protein
MLVLTMAYLASGCKAMPPQASSQSLSSLAEVQYLLDSGELYEAKKLTKEYLAAHPEDAEGVHMMAQILDREITRHKETFETTAIEELTKDEQSDHIKTWMERGQSLLEIGAYDEAALAVENVFQYDANHAEASALMDRIKEQAFQAGKKELSGESEIVQTEVEGRVARYKRQAKTWMEEEKWGAARLAAEKILMLRPEDEEGLELLKQIKAQRQN